jgi:hypothetical protein
MSAFLNEIMALDIAPDIRDDLLGRNAARLLGLMPPAGGSPENPAPHQKTPTLPHLPVTATTPVAAIAAAWPATRAVLDAYGIPWETVEVPFWEPLNQAAAARGVGPEGLARLINDLDTAIRSENETP